MSAESTPTPRILYIGGTGRTGSTTVDQLLGQVPGWFSGGEFAFFWSRGIIEWAVCSCGEPVRDCQVWAKALCAFDDDLDNLATRMVEARKGFWSGHMPLMAVPGFSKRKMRAMRPYLDVLDRLYRSIAATDGVDVIVDSSKEPHYSYLLREGTTLPTSFILLVRDPRATGYSWTRTKPEAGLGKDSYMERRSPWKSSIYFMISNIGSEMLWRNDRDRFRFLRYEDFVRDPAIAMANIGVFMGEAPGTVALPEGMLLDRSKVHTAWGNPNRIGRASIEIREDEGWKRKLSRWDKFVLTVCNLPLVIRYGYPIMPSGRLRSPRARVLREGDLGRR
jgi:hypothetical protein